MKATGTARHRPRAWAALLLSALGFAVAACGGAPDAGRRSPQARLDLTYAMRTYYLPRPDGEHRPSPYEITLKAPEKPGGGAGPAVRGVKVTLDLSAFAGRAKIGRVNKGYGCARSGDEVVCALDDIKSGEGAIFTPFEPEVLRDAPQGPAGRMKMTVTSANATTLHHTTEVVVGAPRLTARQEKPVTGVAPGGEMRLTPAFGNQGDTSTGDGTVVTLTTEQATLRPRYRNCRYDKPVRPTRAECAFPGELRPGTAYETDAPLLAVADESAQRGRFDYAVYRAHERSDAQYGPLLGPSSPRGTGPVLGLRPVDGRGEEFTADSNDADGMAFSGREFTTDRVDDVRAVPFPIKGAVGETVMADVPFAKDFAGKEVRVTLPEGLSTASVDPAGYPSELTFCRTTGRRTAVCPFTSYGTVLPVRIDERVDGARGEVRAPSDPATDPWRKNNTAPVTVVYTG
ncbi:hypothetical protein [Streptomyces sp. NPDC002067]